MDKWIKTIRISLNIAAKTVAKSAHKNQVINIGIVNHPHLVRNIKSGRRLIHGDAEIFQRVYINKIWSKHG